MNSISKESFKEITNRIYKIKEMSDYIFDNTNTHSYSGIDTALDGVFGLL